MPEIAVAVEDPLVRPTTPDVVDMDPFYVVVYGDILNPGHPGDISDRRSPGIRSQSIAVAERGAAVIIGIVPIADYHSGRINHWIVAGRG
jgi:hypothetical protein